MVNERLEWVSGGLCWSVGRGTDSTLSTIWAGKSRRGRNATAPLRLQLRNRSAVVYRNGVSRLPTEREPVAQYVSLYGAGGRPNHQ